MNESPVLDVDHVSVSFSGRQVLDEVTFEIHRGEFTGLDWFQRRRQDDVAADDSRSPAL